MTAPAASTKKLPVSTNFCSRTTPMMSLTLRDWAIISRCWRPILLRSRKISSVATDMKPNPPI